MEGKTAKGLPTTGKIILFRLFVHIITLGNRLSQPKTMVFKEKI